MGLRVSSLPFHFATYIFCLFVLAGVDPVVIESRADEMIGPVSRDEHKALVGHLSGVRRNRVFHALSLSAPQQVAEVKIVECQGAALAYATEKAKVLERAKRKRASSSAATVDGPYVSFSTVKSCSFSQKIITKLRYRAYN